MTKTLFVLAGLLLAAWVGLFVAGLSASAAGLLLLAIMCAGPLFFAILGAAIGRATFEFSVVRRSPAAQRQTVINSRVERAKTGAANLG